MCHMEIYYIANNVYVTMPQAGFEPTEVGVTSFKLNVKRTLYLQATTAGYFTSYFDQKEGPKIKIFTHIIIL